MPKSVRLALVALALAILPSPALAAHLHGKHPGRRAKLDVPATRAPKVGTHALPKKPESTPRPPVERAESVGSPNEGHLQGGVHLDVTRPYFRVVPAYESGDVRWGMPILISLIDRAARAVHRRYPGAVLDVGDISRKGGGDLLRHHSHESGRDADLGFYVLDAKGKQLHHHGFIKFDGALESPTVPGARFDLDRNWLLVQEMLTDPAARVSHIFIAEPLRQRLLAHAKARGVSRALFDRAAVVMMQPTTSLPHDDHMHVRISCPATNRGSCVELAKNAPHGRGRLARKGSHVLHTPARGAKAVAHGKKPGIDQPLSKPPPAVGVAPDDAFSVELPEGDEGDADAAEVKDAVDESGAPKITD